MKCLYALVPACPVSVNALYYPNKWGTLVLSKDGKRYKKDVVESLRQQWMFDLVHMAKADLYEFRYVAFFDLDKLFCKGSNVKHPIQARDVGNLDKILEDAVKDFTGIDDRCYFSIRGIKLPVDENTKERTEIWLFRLDGLEDLAREVASWPRPGAWPGVHHDLLRRRSTEGHAPSSVPRRWQRS